MLSRLWGGIRKREGLAIIGVLMAVLIFSSLCTAILILADQENLISYHQEETLKALYAAEGGIQWVLFQLQRNPQMTWQEVEAMCAGLTSRKPPVGTAFMDGVVPEDLGAKIKFTVTGVSQSAKKVLVAYIWKPLPSRLNPILSQPQETVPQVPEISDLDYEMEYFRELASRNGGHYFTSGQVPKTLSARDLQEMHGVYFAPGDLIIDSSAAQYSGNAVIVAQGSIFLNSSLVPADGTSTLAMVSCGNIELQSTGSFEGVFVACGSLDSNGNEGTITGIAAAGDLKSFTHDLTYNPQSLLGLEEYLCLDGIPARLDLWRERYDIY